MDEKVARKPVMFTGLAKAGKIVRSVTSLVGIWLKRHTGSPPTSLPILLMFITERCNLRCTMCGVWEHGVAEARENELTTEEWKAVLSSARKLGVFLVSITGGEALLRPDVFEIIRHATSLGMSVHLCSNGTLLNETNVGLLRDSGVTSLSVSVDSPTPEVHDSIRGKGNFERTVAGIRLVRKHAPEIRIGVSSLITVNNFRTIADMIPFAESLGVQQIKFAPVHTNLQHKTRSIEQFQEDMLTDKHTPELREQLARLTVAISKSPLQSTSAEFLSGIPGIYGSPRHFKCFAGYVTGAVNAYGIVSPCCDMETTFSVRENPLERIWLDPEFHKIREKVFHCRRPCWDTTNTEIALRMTFRSMLREMYHTWRDFGFYFRGKT